jgi:hypothetical protein
MPAVADLPGRLRVCQYYQDHDPPHFHVQRAEQDTLITIADFKVLRGTIAVSSLREVKEWALAHQAELALNWVLARAGLDMRDIPFP